MNYQAILLFFAALILSVNVFASVNEESILQREGIARHNEIRRELEREAAPVLIDGFNLDIPNIGEEGKSTIVQKFHISVLEYLDDYSIIDLVAGLFSALSLAFGCVYILWTWNPLQNKKIK